MMEPLLGRRLEQVATDPRYVDRQPSIYMYAYNIAGQIDEQITSLTSLTMGSEFTCEANPLSDPTAPPTDMKMASIT